MGKGMVAVIGAGVSGMCAAIAASKAGANVTLFDTNPSFGKKLLKTGNGRCNFSNQNISVKHYHTGSNEHVKSVLGAFGLDKTLEFVKECGIEPKLEGELYYPYSMQAKAVRDCLLTELLILGVNMQPGVKVRALRPDKSRMITESAAGIMNFDAAILACGGMADPESGSDGNGYVLAKNMGHKVITPLPALCPLTSDDVFLKTASGVRIDTNVSAEFDGKKYKETGNLQITDYGISGICTMQLSLHVSKALSQGKKVTVYLDFLPDKKQNEVKGIIDFRFRKNARSKSANTALLGLIPDKLILSILKKSGIDPDMAANNIDEEKLKILMGLLKEYPLNITDSMGFSKAQTTLGGVDLKDIDKNSLSSKLISGLYFCGEMLDVCGECGGFNIQWAISSGMVAGRSCGERL